jgi:phytoene synthase
MMLPILEPPDPEAARGPARALGDAFQLTNFLRDIDEDLDRGRTYIPQEDIRRFGAAEAFRLRRPTPAFVSLLRFEIDRTRRLYREAEVGLAQLPATSARSIAAAHRLYGAILEEIEANRYDVFTTRARVPGWRKVAVIGAGRRQR